MKTFLKKQMLTYVGAGFGLVVGLAWNNAITGLINDILPNKGQGVIAEFLYALVLTGAIGVILYYTTMLIKKEEDAEKARQEKEDAKKKEEADKKQTHDIVKALDK